MQTLRQKLQPVIAQYHRFLNGGYLTDLLAFKGGSSVGNDYVSKVFMSQDHQNTKEYYSTMDNIANPTLSNFFNDNWQRLILLNAFERLVTTYSVYPSLRQRFSMPGTFSHTFTQIMNQGAFRGTMKGVTMSLLQFSCVLYPAMYLTTKADEKNRYWKFLTAYTILDGLLYPLDTIKNILYADTLGKVGFQNVLKQTNFSSLYFGLIKRLIYNVPLVSGFYFTSQAGSERQAMISWVAAALMYPLHTSKIISQVSVSQLGFNSASSNLRQSYRGVVPFLAINCFVGWKMRALYNQQSIEQIVNNINEKRNASHHH